jgi:hypothetical protein
MAWCSTRVVHWLTVWGWTYDPREPDTVIPFEPFPKQAEFLTWLREREATRDNGVVEKSRDMGVTWLCVAYATHGWLFRDGFAVGFGSRKLDLVDKRGDPDSIFEKIRFLLRHLPEWMMPPGFDWREHDNQGRLVNPANGATITGRGRRPDRARRPQVAVLRGRGRVPRLPRPHRAESVSDHPLPHRRQHAQRAGEPVRPQAVLRPRAGVHVPLAGRPEEGRTRGTPTSRRSTIPSPWPRKPTSTTRRPWKASASRRRGCGRRSELPLPESGRVMAAGWTSRRRARRTVVFAPAAARWSGRWSCGGRRTRRRRPGGRETRGRGPGRRWCATTCRGGGGRQGDVAAGGDAAAVLRRAAQRGFVADGRRLAGRPDEQGEVPEPAGRAVLETAGAVRAQLTSSGSWGRGTSRPT